MALSRILSGDPSKTSKLYIAIGGLSLVKAIAVRDDRNRFRQELVDAALFLAAGLALRRYSQLKEEKRAEIESQVPDWAIELATSAPAKRGVRRVAQQRLGGGTEPDPEPDSSLRARARGMLSS